MIKPSSGITEQHGWHVDIICKQFVYGRGRFSGNRMLSCEKHVLGGEGPKTHPEPHVFTCFVHFFVLRHPFLKISVSVSCRWSALFSPLGSSNHMFLHVFPVFIISRHKKPPRATLVNPGSSMFLEHISLETCKNMLFPFLHLERANLIAQYVGFLNETLSVSRMFPACLA